MQIVALSKVHCEPGWDRSRIKNAFKHCAWIESSLKPPNTLFGWGMYFPWDAGLENTKALRVLTFFFGEVPPKPGKTYLRNHFWPLKSGFLAIATYKTRVFSKPSNGPILKFFLVVQLFLKKFDQFLGHFALFYFLGVVKDCCAQLLFSPQL